MKPRPYQSEAVDSIFKKLKDHKSTLVVMATGLGKTRVGAWVVDRLPPQWRTLWVAHDGNLLRQAEEALKTTCLADVEWEKADLYSRHAGIVVASIQTLMKRGRRFAPDAFNLVVFDEAHRAVAPQWLEAIQYFTGARLLGLTATPDRTDGQALGKVFESVAYEYGIKQAIKDGWLCPIRQRFIQVDSLRLEEVDFTGSDLNQEQLEEEMSRYENVHGVAVPTIEAAGDRPTLVFCCPKKAGEKHSHGELLTEAFNSYEPGSAAFISGRMKEEKRAKILQDFKAGKLKRLVNVNLLTEGVDIPSVACIAMARPTASRLKYEQMIGRALRQHQEKEYALVLDFVGNSQNHRLISTFDILGGQYDQETREKAKSKPPAEEPEVDPLEALEEAAKEVSEQRLFEMAKMKVSANYRTYAIDAFSLLGISEAQTPDWQESRPANLQQVEILAKNGIRSDEVSEWQAQKLIKEIEDRKKRGQCSVRQARILSMKGLDPNMSAQKAGWYFDRGVMRWKSRRKVA